MPTPQKPHNDASSYPLTRQISALMGSRGVSLCLRTVASLIVARIAGPYLVGLVAWLGIFPLYASWLTLGVVQGLEYRIPIMRGAERPSEEIETLWRGAWTLVVAAALICLTAGSVVAVVCLAYGHPVGAWKTFFSGCLCAVILFSSTVVTSLSIQRRFALLRRVFLWEGVLWVALVPMAWGGANALVSRMLLATILPPVIACFQAPIFFRPRWRSVVEAIPLIRDGSPILLSNFLRIQGFGLGRVLIALLLTDIELGYYVLAMNVITVIRLAEYSMTKVIQPTIGETFGRQGDKRQVARQVLGTMPRMLLKALVVAVAGWFLAEPLTHWLLPAFLPGVDAARITLLSILPAFLASAHVFFIAIGRQWILIPLFIVGILVQLGISIPLYTVGLGIDAFAWGFLGGITVVGLLASGGVAWYAKSKPSG